MKTRALLLAAVAAFSCIPSYAAVIGDSDWNVSFSMGRFGPNRPGDTAYNNWTPISNDGGGMISNGGAIGSTSIANQNWDGGSGTSIRTFKKDNPFGPNPNAGWTIEEQLSSAEQGALGPMTNFDFVGQASVSIHYRIATGTAIDPRDGTTVLTLGAPSAFKFALRAFDSDGNGIGGDPAQNPGNRDLTVPFTQTGLVADGNWHQATFTIQVKTPAERTALDGNNNNNFNQATLYMLEWVGDALTPMDMYFDNVQVSLVPEPSTYAALAGLGLIVFVYFRRRK